MTTPLPPPPSPPATPPHALGYQSPYGNTDAPLWFNGRYVVTLDRVVFPTRCIKCNGSSDLKTSIQILGWSPPWMNFLFLFPGPVIGALIIVLTQHRATISVATCRDCRKIRLNRILIAWCIFLASLIVFFISISEKNGYIALLATALLLTSAIYAIIACPLISPVKIVDNVVTLKGAGQPFTATLDIRR